ncbi:unnamed protein product [Alopecurus aequalis]
MLELRLVQGSLLKKVLEAIRELVTDANFDCSGTGFSLQAMDSSHVALVALLLRAEGFEHYRCDRSLSMGMNLNNMAKMLRCAGNDDIITIKADDGSDTVTFMFESPNQDKIADFEMKLMDIDSEHLGIPDSEYQAIVRMPSSEFSRICKDLSSIGDTVIISVTKEGVKFSTAGDIGTANIVCRQNKTVDKAEARRDRLALVAAVVVAPRVAWACAGVARAYAGVAPPAHRQGALVLRFLLAVGVDDDEVDLLRLRRGRDAAAGRIGSGFLQVLRLGPFRLGEKPALELQLRSRVLATTPLICDVVGDRLESVAGELLGGRHVRPLVLLLLRLLLRAHDALEDCGPADAQCAAAAPGDRAPRVVEGRGERWRRRARAGGRGG